MRWEFSRSRVFRESRPPHVILQQKESCAEQKDVQANSFMFITVWGSSFSYFGREHTDCFSILRGWRLIQKSHRQPVRALLRVTVHLLQREKYKIDFCCAALKLAD